MDNQEQKIKLLEEKVKILEETIETLKNMQMSEQMQSYLSSRTQTLKIAELINSLSDKPELDLSSECKKVEEIQAKKKDIDEQIKLAINSDNKYLEDFYTSSNCFEYQIEDGIDSTTGELIEELTEYIGKGIRITSYIGFDFDKIVIPKTIDGLPVISIGKKAFINSTVSKVILPNSLIAILNEAFSGCENLEDIILPDGLEFIGNKAFSFSGIIKIKFSKNMKKIGIICFGCNRLKIAIIPENVEKVHSCAFENWSKKTSSVECVFEGLNTSLSGWTYKFRNVYKIYCLPGSEIQKYANEHNIPVKPLSEFKSEE